MFNRLLECVTLSQGVATMNYFKDIAYEGPVKLFTCLVSGAISWLASSFAPLGTVLIILLLLVLVDAFLGCKVSLSKGLKCESRRFWKTLRKFCWCGAIVWFADAIDRNILVSFEAHLVEFFAGIIAGVELWSVLENLTALYPDGPWKILKKFIKSKGEKYLDITIDREDLPKIKKLVKKIKQYEYTQSIDWSRYVILRND